MNQKFADLGAPRRIWAIAAVHGDIERLSTLHDHLAARFSLGDRIVYLGNYVGVESDASAETFDELLAFRAALLAKPGVEPGDIVHLRGPAEEAWLRLLRLQFAPVAVQALDKLMASGVEAYLRLYGVSMHDTRSMARAGSMAITRWTNQLRALQRSMPGHEAMICSMRRAALAQSDGDRKLLFVPAGFDPTRTLDDQGEALWWSAAPFRLAGRAQVAYARIIRGFDSVNNGLELEGAEVTLDGGAGRGGPLVCGCFGADGKLLELVAVGGASALDSMSAAYDDERMTLTPAALAQSQPEYGYAASA